MSPKMSSLALDDVQEETTISFVPELHVISRNRSCSSPNTAIVDDVVKIVGRFTISF